MKFNSKWIDCNHKLPEASKKVLVWRRGIINLKKGNCEISVCRFTVRGPIWDCDQINFPMPAALMKRVTHWMELPEEPTE